VRLSGQPSQLKNSQPLLTNGFQVSGFGWQFRAAFPISPCVPSACRVVGLAKADPIFGTSARDRTTDKRAKACTLRCQPAKPKNRAARGSYPSGLRFPFGYVVCGSSPHWLAMFEGPPHRVDWRLSRIILMVFQDAVSGKCARNHEFIFL